MKNEGGLIMAGNILRRKSSFSALFDMAFACTACADAVYTVDGTTLTVEVPSGELQTLDAAER